ncbi:MAG TPA: SGNH/GDSL hydrolase family protein [Phycisphaerae bacterium]|nr:SGNH/GDSL hydrolase family protein [Phycisphaerae bacterium]HNU45213.1 SGNH/GDSL hydrolase family protein [Phycisphaerae bacterium]
MPGGGAHGYPADYVLGLLLYASLLIHAVCFFKLFPPRWRRLRLVLGNVVVFVCLLASLALLAESYLRFIYVGTESFGVTLPARRWFALHVDLNALGYRDGEWTRDKPPGVRRLAITGDSFVYGWGLEAVRDRFSDRLQMQFNERAPGTVEVMNVAKPGWDTGDQLKPVRDMIERYGVDEVVLGYVANDIERLLPTRPDFDPTKPPLCQLFDTDSSALVEWLYYRLIAPRAPTVRGYHNWLLAGYRTPELWQQQEQRLADLLELCRQHGVTFRVALLPFIQPGKATFPSDGVHAVLRSFFAANGVEVVDLLPALAGEEPTQLIVSRADAHPNAHAHALFAKAIWEAFYAAGYAPEVTPSAPPVPSSP